MNQDDVFKLIKAERDYQDQKFGPPIDNDNSVAHWLVFIEERIARSKKHLYRLEEESAREELVKIASLAVACLEYNDAKGRKRDDL